MKPAALTLLALSLSGCAVQPLALQEDTTYIAEWIGADAVIGRRKVSLTLNEGRAYGSTGCNHWYASYQLNGPSIRFAEIGSTSRPCPEGIAEQERRFLALLGEVQRWDVSNIDQLRLWPARGEPLRFWPALD